LVEVSVSSSKWCCVVVGPGITGFVRLGEKVGDGGQVWGSRGREETASMGGISPDGGKRRGGGEALALGGSQVR